MKNAVVWKNMTLKQIAEHIWEYYRFHILIISAAVIMLGSVIFNMIAYREPDLQVVMIDVLEYRESEQSGFDDFLDAYEYDETDTVIELNTGIKFATEGEESYISTQLLAATILAGDVDVFFWSDDGFSAYIEQGTLMDLSQVLPAQLLAQHEDSLVYMTGEEGECYPCAIRLQDNPWVTGNGYYLDCYFGIFSKTENLQIVSDFAEYILQI